MFVEAIPVDAVFLSHRSISFKNTKLQFILALEEVNILLFLPYFENRVSCNDRKYYLVMSFAVPYCKI